MRQTDLIIIGGGVIGSSVAYHLLKEGFEGEILILKKIRFMNIHLRHVVPEESDNCSRLPSTSRSVVIHCKNT